MARPVFGRAQKGAVRRTRITGKVSVMRMLLTAKMDNEKANHLITDGTMGKTLEGIMEELKPEAAYFTAWEGERTALLVIDLEDSNQMPIAAEPFFQAGAKVSLRPVMNPDDLKTGLESLGR